MLASAEARVQRGPHRRMRFFLAAARRTAAANAARPGGRDGWSIAAPEGPFSRRRPLPAPAVTDRRRLGRRYSRARTARQAVAHPEGHRCQRGPQCDLRPVRPGLAPPLRADLDRLVFDWRGYAAAIHRWERLLSSPPTGAYCASNDLATTRPAPPKHSPQCISQSSSTAASALLRWASATDALMPAPSAAGLPTSPQPVPQPRPTHCSPGFLACPPNHISPCRARYDLRRLRAHGPINRPANRSAQLRTRPYPTHPGSVTRRITPDLTRSSTSPVISL
jgi:hypothetical protein